MTKSLVIAGLAGVLLLNSCTPYQAQGAGIGALGGAALGAVAGNDRGDVLAGAALGAAVGTGVAAAQENERRRTQADYDHYRNSGDRYDYDTPPPRETPRDDYPYAKRTSNPNQVISPFGPNYNVIDVAGFKSGQLARDPSNGKIFRVP